MKKVLPNLADLVEDVFGEFSAEVTDSSSDRRYQTVVGRIVVDGTEIGAFQRELAFENGRLVLHHAGMSLDAEWRRRGIARTWSTRCFARYRAARVAQVRVRSGATHVWARLGFDWADMAAPGLSEMLGRAIEATGADDGDDALAAVAAELAHGVVRPASGYLTIGSGGSQLLERLEPLSMIRDITAADA